MKRIITLAAFAAAMITGASAQTVQIKTVSGETKVYNLSQVESITFSDEAKTEELVSMEVINVSAYAFDLKVNKSASCKKYMAAAYHKEVFDERSFVESAEQTLDVNAYYRPFEQAMSYDSGTFSEVQLGLNAVASEDGKVAPEFVVAVYAIDDLGETKVYTKEFSIPAKPTVSSSEKATVEINEKTLTFNHVDFTVRCGWNTAKVIYAVTQPSYIDSKLTVAKWNAMSASEQEAKLLSVFQGVPEKYKSGMKGSYDCTANSTCIVYAIPIDKDGNIGHMDIKTVNTGAIPVDGTGAFTSLTQEEQTSEESITFNVGVDENAVAYRLMMFTEDDEKNSGYIARMAEMLYDTKYQEYGMWTEFPATETKATLEVFRSGKNYYLYGVTIDRFGRMSAPVNLGETYLGTKLIPTL